MTRPAGLAGAAGTLPEATRRGLMRRNRGMLPVRRSVQFGRSRICFQLRRTNRRRTVQIAVDPVLGVSVAAPRTLSHRGLNRVVLRKAPWIIDKICRLREIAPPPDHEFVSGETFPYLGRNYRLKVVARRRGSPTIASTGREFRISVPAQFDRSSRAKAIRDVLASWYRRRAAVRLPQRVAHWARRLGIHPPVVGIRGQRKRWGSCDPRGRVLLNWQVVMAPMSLVDYVVVHEACHLLRQDHGREFRALVGRLLPDWEERRARLRKEGARYSL